MERKLDEIAKDVKEIKSTVIELGKAQAVHNHILNEHHKRSTALEDRMLPVEDHVKFMSKLAKIALGSSGILTLVIAFLSLIFTALKLTGQI